VRSLTGLCARVQGESPAAAEVIDSKTRRVDGVEARETLFSASQGKCGCKGRQGAREHVCVRCEFLCVCFECMRAHLRVRVQALVCVCLCPFVLYMSCASAAVLLCPLERSMVAV